jgi:CRP-like cAMP-binding protein
MLPGWLGKPRVEADVALLVARKQYGQAIDALRKSFTKRLPDANQRLHFAALLVLARRGDEAVPVLLGLAEEHTRMGFPDRALQMLDRIDMIQPGRPDVARRRAALEADRTEWAEPIVLSEDLPFEEPPGEEREPVALPPLEEPSAAAESARSPDAERVDLDALPEDEPLLADLDASDPIAWAGAIADAAYGLSEEAARSIEDGDTNPFGYPMPDLKTLEKPSAAPIRSAVAELPHLLQELSGRGPRADGRPTLAAALLSDLSRARLLTLVPRLRGQSFAAGDVILNEGETGQSLFFIAHGEVRVLVRSPYGRSFEVATLQEDDFFGEVAVISGGRRSASIVAKTPCDVVEMPRRVLEPLLRGRQEAQALLEEACVARATSPACAAVRTMPREATESRERARTALTAHFGATRWSLRMRLRLADVLLKSGNQGDAVAILTSVADALAAANRGDKALAILQKIASIRRRDVEEICLAPLARGRSAPARGGGRAARSVAAPERVFRDWILQRVREAAEELADEDGQTVTLH